MSLVNLTSAATTEGHHTAINWTLTEFGGDLVWDIEDCRQMSTRLERDLLGAGQTAVPVPTKLMAQARSSARTHGKSDPIDALAVARAVLREPDLPAAGSDPNPASYGSSSTTGKSLSPNALRQSTACCGGSMRINPAYAPKTRSLSMNKHQKILATHLANHTSLLADIAREELDDIISLTARINKLATEISKRVRQLVPTLLELPGCAELTAGKIVGETAGISRFCSADTYASTAPVPVWSGNSAGRVRLLRHGNRQLNTHCTASP